MTVNVSSLKCIACVGEKEKNAPIAKSKYNVYTLCSKVSFISRPRTQSFYVQNSLKCFLIWKRNLRGSSFREIGTRQNFKWTHCLYERTSHDRCMHALYYFAISRKHIYTQSAKNIANSTKVLDSCGRLLSIYWRYVYCHYCQIPTAASSNTKSDIPVDLRRDLFGRRILYLPSQSIPFQLKLLCWLKEG